MTSNSNGNSIFLPAAGHRWDAYLDFAGSHGCYWSGTLGDGSDYYACDLDFDSGDVDWDDYDRFNGQSVRPVCQ